MFKRTKVCSGVMLAFGGGLALGVLPAQAQQTTQIDRIEVTGSSIRRIAAEQSLPVTIISTDDLAKLGVSNAEQAVKFLTSNQSSTTSTVSVGATNGGAANADLRGLGVSRTLVLVNGKRIVNNPYLSAAVDLNTLPFGAIERIEALTDGASAIYGTDAIAGVINFITRKEYAGVSLTADALLPTTTPGDGRQGNMGVTAGYGSLAKEGWNIFGGVSYHIQQPLAAKDRDYAKTAYMPEHGFDKTSGTSFPGNYFQGDLDAVNPSYPNCNLPASIPIGGICRFDYVPFIDIIPRQEQLSIIGRASYAINKDNTIAVEYLQGNNNVSAVISPTPLTNLAVVPGNPFYPGNGTTPANTDPGFDPTKNITVGWRQTTLGGRSSEIENETNRILLSWEGSYRGWDYSVSAFQSEATVKNTFNGGYVSSQRVRDGLAGLNGAPFLNPFGAQSAAGQAYLESAKVLGQVQEATGTLQEVLAQVSGEIWKLPAGPMMLAVGAEFLHDKADYTNNFTLIRQAASSGLELAEDSTGSRRDTAFSGELSIPITKAFELNLAVRYDDYSDFGGTTNAKASFRWQPMQSLLFRGSYNQGFRAPTLQDVYAPNSITFTGQPYNDPLLCPNGTAITALGGVQSRDCGLQFQQQQGGNRNLKPETSDAWTVGVALQPIASTTLGIDYWNYKVSSSIGPTGEDVIFGNPTLYSDLFIRCGQLSAADQARLSNVCGQGASPNALAYIINGQLNLGNYKTSGLDFYANWQSEATKYGKFNAGIRGTYVLVYEYQLEKDAVYNDNLGIFFNGSPVAQYRQVLNFGWQYGPWSTQLVERYSSGYTDQNTDENGNLRRVAGNNVWDLAVTWSGVKGLALTAGLQNMFDYKPPFSNQDGGFQVGYDYRYANPIGRAVLLKASYQF